MTSPAEHVREFHERFDVPIGDLVERHPEREDVGLRIVLHEEEHDELVDELEALSAMLRAGGTRAEFQTTYVRIARELADVVYIAYGTALSIGIDLDAVLAEIHRSNMSKLDDDGQPVRRADGKILKGPNFFEPNVALAMIASMFGELDP